ncbi:MAG: ATP-grasp domain-containing protein [Bacteroidia bacterium]|nr:ATP-grasp domain-containing protein [Bacteroidia bacterium]
MNNEEIWLVAVTAGRWQSHGIKEAKAAGLKVIAIDEDPDAEGFHYADLSFNLDFNDFHNVVRTLRGLDKNIRGAVSFCSEAGMFLAALLCEEFNCPGICVEMCKKLTNKAMQRKIWSESGIPGPIWKVCLDQKETIDNISSFEFPLIIKPTDSSGSRGVTKIENYNDVKEAVENAFKFSKSGQVLLESYMDGTEFTIEVFADRGRIHVLAVTEKKKVEGTRGTVASELATPQRSRNVIEQISNTVISAFTALHYTDGPGHAEIILQNNGNIGLVEVAGRGGGFMVFDRFVPAASGINIARLTALQAVGIPIGEIERTEKSVVLRFFPSRPGTLLSINGFADANQIEGVEASPFVKIGDHFHHAVADGDRLGYILSIASNPTQAQELADLAESLIKFEFC